MTTHLFVYACLTIGLFTALVGGVFQAFSDFVMSGIIRAAPAGRQSRGRARHPRPAGRLHRAALFATFPVPARKPRRTGRLRACLAPQLFSLVLHAR